MPGTVLWALWALATPAEAAAVRLTADDGAALVGESWGAGARGVLLVHDEGRSRADWELVAPKLAAAGFRVLAIDLRGHGGSTLPAPLAEGDWPKLTADVAAGVQWLVAEGATEVHVVGERLGANLALAATEGVTDLVLVSPALNVRGIRVSTGVEGLGERSVLVVAGAQDPVSVKTGQWIVEQAAGPSRVELLPEAKVGERLVNVAPEAVNLVLAWIDGGAAKVASSGPGEEPPLKTGEVRAIETRGTRLEERKR
jgi:dienelactone hydrolase